MKYDRVKMTKAIPLRLNAELLDRIKRLSERIGEPQSTVMRIAMRIGLERLEKAFASATPPNLSNLICPSPSEEMQIVEDRPAKLKKTRAA